VRPTGTGPERASTNPSGWRPTSAGACSSLAPPPWMGLVEAGSQAQAPEEKDPAFAKLQQDYGKVVEAPELADVVLVVEGGALPRATRGARGSAPPPLPPGGGGEGEGEAPGERTAEGAQEVRTQPPEGQFARTAGAPESAT
jgi:hypothetical protein